MLKLQYSDFKKNTNKLYKLLKDGSESITVDETLYVYYPKRFEEIGLSIITTTVKVLGVFILANEKNEYLYVNIPLILELEPSLIEDVMIEDVLYTRLTLSKGNKLIVSKKVIKDGGFIFTLIDEFCLKGKIPFYVEYDKLAELFLSSGKFNGSKIGNNPAGISTIVSIITRDKKDLKKFIRSTNKDLKKLSRDDIEFVGLSDVEYGIPTNIGKLTGPYLNDGITSVLVNNDEVQEETEIEKYYKK